MRVWGCRVYGVGLGFMVEGFCFTVMGFIDGLPCCDGTVDFWHQRGACLRPCTKGLPAPGFLRNFAGPEGCWFQLSFDRDGLLVFVVRLAGNALGAAGERVGGRENRRLRNTGRCALTALREKRTARASGVLIDSLNPPPITPSRRCANPWTRKQRLSAFRGPKLGN